MNFLHDPTTQFIVNIAIALLGITIATVVSIVIFQRQKSRKALAFEVISNTQVLSVEKEIANKVQVLFNGQSVSEASLVVIRLFNSGNQDIKVEDYDANNPIKFQFVGNAKVLDAEVIETAPRSIASRATLIQDTSSVALKPLLLNSKDSIKLKVLLTQLSSKVSVDARIAGVSEIREMTTKRDWRLPIVIVVIIFLAALSVTSIIASITGNNSVLSTVTIIFVILGVILSFASWLFPLGVQRKNKV